MIRTAIRLLRDERGVYAIEFVIIFPVFLILLLGGFDMAHTTYARGVMQGVVIKASRDATLETGTAAAIQTTIDNRVRDSLLALNNTADITISRRFYRTFKKASDKTPEPFTDTNGNGTCDGGEPYSDQNRNGTFDADGGDEGQGNARDIVIYKVEMTYPRLFPTSALLGFPANVDLTTETYLGNQPYGQQQSYGAPLPRNCT